MANAVYMRVGNGWMRRTDVTPWSSGWLNAQRVPRQVREVGKEHAAGGTLVIAFDTKAKTAVWRPWW